MASIKDLKKRISTVKNTQQTTKAMKMVSAAKLRRAQSSIFAQRPYARKIGELIRTVSAMSEAPLTSRLVQTEESLSDSDKKVLVVLVTSDRGLCGGFNSNVIKKGWAWIEENRSTYSSINVAFVGRKAREYFVRRGHQAAFYEEFGRTVEFDHAKKINNWLVDAFVEGKFDSVKFVYNEFKNAITQTVIVEDFLPLREGQVKELVSEERTSPDLYIVKPSVPEVLDLLLRKHFTIQVMRILLESQASEHGARMSAMDSATRNAGEMIRSLTLQFNKQRQAGITKELLEIIAGSESQKS